MSLLVLVRHGKASAFSQHGYDELSAPGFAQARALGEWWAEQRIAFDRIYVGPRKRHAQTFDTVAEVMRARGAPLPSPIALDELDEHEGIKLVFTMIPIVAKEDETVRPAADALARGELPPASELLAVFRRITRRWARGELNHHEVESFSKFRRRIERGLAVIAKGAQRGETIAAFTSAGAVAAAAGLALEITDEKVLDLSWALHNGSLSELSLHGTSEPSWGLKSFNGTPHLRDPALVTSV